MSTHSNTSTGHLPKGFWEGHSSAFGNSPPGPALYYGLCAGSLPCAQGLGGHSCGTSPGLCCSASSTGWSSPSSGSPPRVGCASILGSLLAGPLLERFGPRLVLPVAALFGVAGALAHSRIRPPRLPAPPSRPSLREVWHAAWADRNFRWVLVATFAFGFGGWTMAPAIPLLLVDVLQARPTQVGILAAASNAASVVGFFLGGRVIDRSSGLSTLRRALMVSPLTPLLYALVPSAWTALAPAAADGFLIAVVELAWMTTAMELAPPHLVVHYAGAYTSLIGVRGILAPLLAGALLESLGPRPVLLLSALWMATAGATARLRLRP